MSSEEEVDIQEVEAEEVDESDIGDEDAVVAGEQIIRHQDEEDDEDEEEDEAETVDNGHESSLLMEDEDEITVKSNNDASSQDDDAEDDDNEEASNKQTDSHNTPKTKPIKAGHTSSSSKKGRVPSVAGLTIPFRTVKKAMKLDPDTPIVQNEAAVMLTYASELFLRNLAKQSYRYARDRGRHVIRYEDIAEARTNDPALSFLEMLLP